MCPIWLPVFSYFFYNEPELGVGVDPGMALTPLPSSIGRGLNPRPSDHEPSALLLDHGFRLTNIFLIRLIIRHKREYTRYIGSSFRLAGRIENKNGPLWQV